MMKSALVLLVLLALAHQLTITPIYILPDTTTRNAVGAYSFRF